MLVVVHHGRQVARQQRQRVHVAWGRRTIQGHWLKGDKCDGRRARHSKPVSAGPPSQKASRQGKARSGGVLARQPRQRVHVA